MTRQVAPQDYRGVVTVVVPLYNHERTVERSLNSVLSSSTDKIELIVSDDGSRDSSADVAQSWLDLHSTRFASARLIRHPINLGITAHLNFLIDVARGEYMTALGSDDELTANAIDVQRQFLEAAPDKDFVFANVVSIDDKGRVQRQYFNAGDAGILNHPICGVVDAAINWSMPWGRLFARRTALQALGPYIDTHSFEDRWSGLKIVQTGRFGYLAEVVYRYRARSAGTGTAGLDSAKLDRDWWDVENRLLGETTGLLHVLLLIRTRSAKSDRGSFSVRVLWRLAHRAAFMLHRTAIRIRRVFIHHATQ